MKVLAGDKPKRPRRPKVVPKAGDYYVLGLMKYPVVGYAADTNSLMYLRSYADKHDPVETDLSLLTQIDKDWSPTWWIAKDRVGGGKKLWFVVTFPWQRGEQSLATSATTMRKARQNVLHRIGVELCNVSPERKGAPERAAREALAFAANKEFNLDMLRVRLELKN
jgi:hypothetical protein